ncbi:hypothetical protein [Youngiibacter multivorans]|uniref:Uncharacterized protein n=1 Tax=Youngiibacter multivorans TaxID=937251 RepID=A0ABS4G8M9_9CLOT|nr:hypothetical protein [Youngiibacter multivorans]MBP1920891.1 hypothetical protein [Youngiibacter multivorans]
MMDAHMALDVLNEMLNESGFDFDNPNPKLAWDVFKEFSNIKVDVSDDALLFQCGEYDHTGETLFHFELVRQFSFEVDEEYDHMEQLRLTIYYKPNEELKGLDKTVWTYDYNSKDEFFNELEKIDSIRIPLEKYVPFAAETDQEEI